MKSYNLIKQSTHQADASAELDVHTQIAIWFKKKKSFSPCDTVFSGINTDLSTRQSQSKWIDIHWHTSAVVGESTHTHTM